MDLSPRVVTTISQAAGPRLTSKLLLKVTSKELTNQRDFLNWCKQTPKPEPVDNCPPEFQVPSESREPSVGLESPALPKEVVSLPKPCPSPNPSVKEDPHIIVIGAGIAGLSAAARLLRSGRTNITILEARGRPGGRILSTVLGDVVAELGADVAYPCFDSLAYRLAAADGFLDPAPRMDPARSLFTHPDGHPIHSSIVLLAYQRYRKAEEFCERFVRSSQRQLHGDFAEIIGRRLRSEVQMFPSEHRYAAARIMFGLAASRRMMSSRDNRFIQKDYHGAALDFPGALPIPLGLRGALAGLLRLIGPDIPKYNKVVTGIRWGINSNGDPEVTVCCEDGDAYAAQYAIVTLPLGVLKEEHRVMFSPPLPYDKTIAFECLEVHHINKIFLEYGKETWFWRNDPALLRFPEGMDKDSAWVAGLCRLSEHPGSNYVLSGVVLGEHAVQMEMHNDAEVIETLTKAMRQALENRCIPYPVDMIRSKWRTDRYTGGASTSYEAPELRSVLSEPVPDTTSALTPALLFAGEATSTKPGTLQGAAVSGLREAQRLLNILDRRVEQSACPVKVGCSV